MGEDDLKQRVIKTMELFEQSARALRLPDDVSKETRFVVDLSKMYASDAKSFLDKGDVNTAFASIEYAHGLLDAIRELNGQGHGTEKQ